MLLHVHDQFRISDLQARFSKCFPSLKIEFYQRPHHPNERSNAGDLLDPRELIGEIRKNHTNGDLDIKSWNTAGEVEREFKEQYGLNVQVFRRGPAGWEQTAVEDKFTLHENSL